MKRIMIVIFLFLSITACTAHLGNYSVLSSKKDIGLNGKYEKVDDTVVGTDIEQVFVVVRSGKISIEDAVNDALEKSGADVLRNVEITGGHYYIPLIYGKAWIEVKGEPWKHVIEISQQ